VKPGKNFEILDRILQGGSLADIPISSVGGEEDEAHERRQPLTEEEAQARRSWFDKTQKGVK